MKIMRILLLLLAFSIVLQNTCPYGFAAKTSFAALQTHECPLKKGGHSPAKDRDSVDGNTDRALYPAFVLSLPELQDIMPCSQMNAAYTPLPPGNYRNPFKDPLARPPAV